MYELRHYTTPEGQDLFAQWLNKLRDRHAQAGAGYRVYYAIEGKNVVLLCDGGDKRTQDTDIERAITRWSEWQQRSKK